MSFHIVGGTQQTSTFKLIHLYVLASGQDSDLSTGIMPRSFDSSVHAGYGLGVWLDIIITRLKDPVLLGSASCSSSFSMALVLRRST